MGRGSFLGPEWLWGTEIRCSSIGTASIHGDFKDTSTGRAFIGKQMDTIRFHGLRSTDRIGTIEGTKVRPFSFGIDDGSLPSSEILTASSQPL
jgi:hypothetical protein